MIVGAPRETKPDEYRVGIMPVGAELLIADGHSVLVESGAGCGSGFDDSEYTSVGAEIVDTAGELFRRSEMLVKVKEPQSFEIEMLQDGQVVFTYFHFASSIDLTRACLSAGIEAVAYETLQDASGRLPLLTPMSEVAGKMAVQEGAKCLEKPMMGRGILLGGVPGVKPATVLVLGAGVVGSNAARMAAGFGANVVLMDINLDRLRYMSEVMPANVTTIHCDPHSVAEYSSTADLVIGAVLIPGALAPRLLTAQMVSGMKPGSVIVDVCIDQGGCVETSRPTTHGDPTFVVDGVVHYCVGNMPGAVGRTSSQALCNATLPYARQLAALGVDDFAAQSPGHAEAINMRRGELLNAAVGEAFDGELG
ncbi:MAG: alanine dehydrogenase [Phycisphaerae bacterium]|nr:alanine dehydrogenase [Phycisphaerae bacterium]